MRKYKRLVGLILSATMICGFITPGKKAKGVVNDVDIISETSVSVTDAKIWAREKGATDTFVNLADLFWKYASSNGGVNPAVAYAQSAVETGYGKFGGVITEEYRNTCGLKTRQGGDDKDPNAHQKFNTWDEGVQAHLDHLALYAGAEGYPRTETFDPRHFASIYGKSPTVKGLSSSWATDPIYAQKIMNLYNEILAVAARELKPRGQIDEPQNNFTVSNSLTVRGWALNASGIAEVKVYIDGSYVGSAQTGQARPDVQAAYPNYADSLNSGYSLTVNVSNLSSGRKTLKVEQIGNDGYVNTLTTQFNISRLAPRGDINDPWANQSISGNTLNVRGWAINGSGIKEVKVYVDGKFVGNATTGLNRPDVGSAYPDYPDAAKSEYKLAVDISNVAAGNKKVLVEQIGNDGTVYKVERNFNRVRSNLPARGDINDPWANQSISGNTLNIRGWALNGSGIKEVKVYVDGKFVGNATTGLNRPDVGSAYPDYPDAAKSEYKLAVDISQVAAGNRKVLVEQIGNDGTVYKVERTFNRVKSNLPARGDINDPWANQSISGNTLNIRGWALNGSGIKEVKVYVDGKFVGNATTGLNRPDVASAYPDYPNAAKSEYKLSVDISALSAGTRKVVVEQVGNDGSVYKVERSFNRVKSNLSPLGDINDPWDSQTISTNTLKVRGWALNGSGIKEVKVYVDGKFKGNATIGLTRTDVANAYPQYPEANKSGYELTVDLSDIANGSRLIAVEQVGKDGTVKKIERRFVKANQSLKPMGDINDPFNNLEVSGPSLYVRGWAINGAAIKEVKVYVDGKFKGNANLGLTRTDVGNAYPQYPNANKSGYDLTVDISEIPAGRKIVKVEQIGNDGSKFVVERTVNVVRKQSKSDINEPTGLITTDNIRVRGWAIADAGVKAVSVYLDNNFIANATLGLSRPDVAQAYPSYTNSINSGYELVIDGSKVTPGRHTIKVEVVGKDGSVIVQTKTFDFKNSKLTVVIDAGHNASGDTGAQVTHNGKVIKEEDLNIQIAGKLKRELEKRGVNVIMTREEGEHQTSSSLRESLQRRVDIANNANVDFFVSIHHNKEANGNTASGVEVYYSSAAPNSRSLLLDDGREISIGRRIETRDNYKVTTSKKIATEMSAAIAGDLSMKNRGPKDDDFFVVKNTTMPSVLVETGFMSNPSELAKIMNPDNQQKIAVILANTITNNFK